MAESHDQDETAPIWSEGRTSGQEDPRHTLTRQTGDSLHPKQEWKSLVGFKIVALSLWKGEEKPNAKDTIQRADAQQS